MPREESRSMLRALEVSAINTGYAHAVSSEVAFGPDGENLLVSTWGDGLEIRRWDIASGDSIWRYAEELPGCNDVVLVTFPDGRRILAMSTEDGVERWNALTGERLDVPDSFDWITIWDLATGTLPDGRTVLVGASNNHTVYRWDPASGEPLGDPLRGHGTSVMSVGLVHLPESETLIVSGDDAGFLRRWNAVTGDPIGVPVKGHPSQVNIISPLAGVGRQKLFASSDAEGTICRWDAVTGEQVGEPLTTGADVHVLATACPGLTPLLLAAGPSGRISAWHAVTGEPVDLSLRGLSVATLDQPDGTTLVVTGTSQGEIVIYSLSA